MPLIPKLAFAGRNRLYTESYLEDKTGAFDPQDNPGGYGGTNPTRAQVALFLFSRRRTPTEDVLVLPLANDALTVSTFILPVAQDSVYRHQLIAVLVLNEVLFPALPGDLRYFPEDRLVKRLDSDAENWLLVKPEELLESNLPTGQKHEFAAARAEELFHRQNLTVRDLLRQGAQRTSEQEQAECRLRFIRVQRTAAKNFFCLGEYTSAQQCLDAIHNQPV